MFDAAVEWNKITAAADYLRVHLGTADIGIVLGSGLGGFVEELQDAAYVNYSDIPDFPVSTVPGHVGRWWKGELAGKNVYMLQGRFHAYEGYSLQEITRYVRVMKELGVHTLILTNACGCVNTAWNPGELMLIEDVINFFGPNPLTGPNIDQQGLRFPDMSHVFDPQLIDTCKKQADEIGLTIRQGVYMWFSGPCFETPAEIRMARIMGADAVGMSTVPEAIVGRHCGLKMLGISCMTNMAAGILDQPLTHEEVQETADRVKGSFQQLLAHTVSAM